MVDVTFECGNCGHQSTDLCVHCGKPTPVGVVISIAQFQFRFCSMECFLSATGGEFPNGSNT